MGGLLDRPAWTKGEREVITEWIAADAKQRPLGRLIRCPLCCYNRMCPVLSYVYFTGFGLVAMVLLAFFAVMIVRPHLYARQFVQGSCETTGSRYTGAIEQCSCGTYCESSFPCLEITIRLSTPSRKHFNTCLYYSPSELQEAKCSYRPRCEAFTHRMSDEISRYERKFGPVGVIYPCLYNPSNPQEVVKSVHTLGDEMVVSVVLWPIVAALTCLMFLLTTYLICGCKPYVCTRHPPAAVTSEARRREEVILSERKRKQDERSHLKVNVSTTAADQSATSTQQGATPPEGSYQSAGSLLHEPSELQAIIDKAS